jgi:hypothetical protein
MATKLKLDSKGIGDLLKSREVASAVMGAAKAVSSGIDEVAHDGKAVPVELRAYTSNRAVVAVTLLHAAGLGLEAKRGTLTRAASAAGLEVTGRSR